MAILCLALAAMTVFTEWESYGPPSIRSHESQAESLAASPREFFRLSERLLASWSLFLTRRGFSPGWGLVSLRFFQNALIFLLAWSWWKKLGLAYSRRIIGLLLLAWGLLYAFREGRIDTGVFWTAVWTLAGILLLSGRRRRFYPLLAFLGAPWSVFSVILPVLPLAAPVRDYGEEVRRGESLIVALSSTAAWAAGILIFCNLSGRIWPTAVWGRRPGLELAAYNLGHSLTWVRLVWLCSVLPVVALLTFPRWPRRLRRLAPITLIPPAVSLFIVFFPDHRLVLIPLAVFLVPGFLFLTEAGTALGIFRFSARRLETLMIILLAAAALYSQLWVLGGVGGRYLRETQVQRHREVMDGSATSPWRYRVLSQALVEGALRLGAASGVEEAGVVFSLFRLMQNLLIFYLAAALLRGWGFSASERAIGLTLAGWGMMHAFYNSDLAFSTYTDLVIYLLGALAVTRGRLLWFIPLAAAAALNRETGVLLPALLLPAAALRPGRRERLIFIGSLGLFFAIFFSLRYVFLPGPSFVETWGAPGWTRLARNLSTPLAWRNVFLVANLTPLVALAAVRRWPGSLRDFFLPAIPAWLFLHYYAKAFPEETRFLLVPLFLGFVPAVLCLLKGEVIPASDHEKQYYQPG